MQRLFQQLEMKRFSVKVEEGREGKDGKPSVGPVYRNVLAEKDFPSVYEDLSTSWDLFRLYSVHVLVMFWHSNDCVKWMIWCYCKLQNVKDFFSLLEIAVMMNHRNWSLGLFCSVSAKRYAERQMLGWRKFVEGKVNWIIIIYMKKKNRNVYELEWFWWLNDIIMIEFGFLSCSVSSQDLMYGKLTKKFMVMFLTLVLHYEQLALNR